MLLARRAGPANCNAASLHCCFRTERKKHKVKSLVFKGCDRSKKDEVLLSEKHGSS